MTKRTGMLALMLVAALGVPAFAGSSTHSSDDRKSPRTKTVSPWDADGDGFLSPTEKKAALEAHREAKRQERLDRSSGR